MSGMFARRLLATRAGTVFLVNYDGDEEGRHLALLVPDRKVQTFRRIVGRLPFRPEDHGSVLFRGHGDLTVENAARRAEALLDLSLESVA